MSVPAGAAGTDLEDVLELYRKSGATRARVWELAERAYRAVQELRSEIDQAVSECERSKSR